MNRIVMLIIAVALSSCLGREESHNKESQERYHKARAAIEASGYPYNNSKNAEREYSLLGGINEAVVLERRYKYFEELLYAGQNDLCIDLIKRHLSLAHPSNKINRGNRKYYRLLALAYLRQGEVVNCINHHSPQSCILPLEGGGIHVEKTGARQAFELYKRLLAFDKDDAESRWLINIAAMAADVPVEDAGGWILERSVFDSDMDFVGFKDIAGQMEVDVRGRAGGSSLEDFNNDGILDIFCSSYGLDDQCRLFLGTENGTFVDRTAAFGLNGIFKALNFVHADYDDDGWMDILLLRGGWLKNFGHFPNALLRNVEGRYFKDVTMEAGVLQFAPSQTADFGDVDLDGDLDLVIGNEYYGQSKIPSRLFINRGDGTFSDESSDRGLDINRFVKAVVLDDFNNDRYADLYVSVYGGENMLYENTPGDGGKRVFIDKTSEYGVAKPVMSFPVMPVDVNNDGWQDLVVSSYDNTDVQSMLEAVVDEYLAKVNQRESVALYINSGAGYFSEEAALWGLDKSLLTMGCNYGDLNNDGWEDLYFGTGEFSLPISVPNRMFLNRSGKGFSDVTTEGGFGQIQKGHGVSFGDIDRDGDQDIYHVVGGALEGDVYQNMLLENPGMGNNWVVLSLNGISSNSFGVGAKVRIKITGEEGSRDIWKTVSTGGTFGNNSIQLEIGLGSASVIDEIFIQWPIDPPATSVFYDVDVNNKYRIIEQPSQILVDEFRSIDLQKKQISDHRH